MELRNVVCRFLIPMVSLVWHAAALGTPLASAPSSQETRRVVAEAWGKPVSIAPPTAAEAAGRSAEEQRRGIAFRALTAIRKAVRNHTAGPDTEAVKEEDVALVARLIAQTSGLTPDLTRKMREGQEGGLARIVDWYKNHPNESPEDPQLKEWIGAYPEGWDPQRTATEEYDRMRKAPTSEIALFGPDARKLLLLVQSSRKIVGDAALEPTPSGITAARGKFSAFTKLPEDEATVLARIDRAKAVEDRFILKAIQDRDIVIPDAWSREFIMEKLRADSDKAQFDDLGRIPTKMDRK
jgi:hypothetical protein